MPTNPAPRPRSLPGESHRARDIAESFGVDPARYDRTRPRYPEAALTAVLAASPGRQILDVGIGTGIVARQLAASGGTVTGVDPDARMAEFARDSGFEVDIATFEEWRPDGRRFDAVVAGQTWHWVDPVAGAAKAARVLRPGGRLAVFWNVSAPPAALQEAFAAVYLRVLPDSPLARMAAAAGSPQTHDPLVAKASDGIERSGAFGAPERWEFPWHQDYTRDEWLELSMTSGLATRLPRPVLDELLTGLGAVIDAAGGRVACAYRTVVVTAAVP